MWDIFGLQSNPFAIKAVEMYGGIPVSTFIGRSADRDTLKQIIATRSHSLSLVVGDKGIGKTSLGNVVKSDLSGTHFGMLSEIDTQHDWSSSEFILQALGNIYETACLVDKYPALPRKYVGACQKLRVELKPLFEDESSGGGLQIAGVGFDKSQGRGLSRPAVALLRLKLKNAVNIIRESGYVGVILQFNNLDNIEEEKHLSRILADLRDFLLTDYCHFIFLGNKTMEACFKANSKVNDCISCDIQLGPLTYPEIKRILDKRYDEFKIAGRVHVPPVLDDALKAIHALHDGNIRQIFHSLDNAVINSGRILGQPQQLNEDKIRRVLYKQAEERITGEMQPRALDVLFYVLKAKKPVTNTEIAKKLKLKNQNTSKYLNQLKVNNLIVTTEKEGRNVYYKAVNEARWLLLKPEKEHQTMLGG